MGLNEKDTMSDILMQEKEIIKVYGTFLPEGSSAEIRTVLSNNMDVIANQQFQVFEAMKNKGYYKIKMADANEINQTKTTYSQ
ncbi:MAG: spore coat protein [Christensenellales bacterium]|jgi:spore coat protein F